MPSLQLIGHFLDPGLDASLVLFAAGRARSAGCPDDLVAHLDRQRALVGYDVGEMDQAERRILSVQSMRWPRLAGIAAFKLSLGAVPWTGCSAWRIIAHLSG